MLRERMDRKVRSSAQRDSRMRIHVVRACGSKGSYARAELDLERARASGDERARRKTAYVRPRHGPRKGNMFARFLRIERFAERAGRGSRKGFAFAAAVVSVERRARIATWSAGFERSSCSLLKGRTCVTP